MIRVVASSTHYGDLDFEALFSAAIEDRGLVVPANDIDYQGRGFETHELSRVSGSANLASTVLAHAWDQAQLSSHRNRLDGRGHRERDPKTALVVGYSLAQLDNAFVHGNLPNQARGPYTLSTLRGNAITAPLAIRFGIGGGTHLVSSASATGGQAITTAGQLIMAGQVERVAVVCLDHFAHPETERLMRVVGAVSDNPEGQPLSEDRSGMRPVSAAAAMIFESEDSCHRRGLSPAVSWLSGAIRNDCYHLIAPEPSSTALLEATQSTLERAAYQPEDVHWLSLHATGTRVWDAIEADAVRRVFPNSLPHLSAFKRTFGHTLGAAGMFEGIMLVEALKLGTLPPPLENVDPTLGLNTSKHSTASTALMWSAGMGGDVAVNLFGRHDGSTAR